MQVSSGLGERVYKLTRAVLLREASGQGKGEAIATFHSVITREDGTTVLGPGDLLRDRGLSELVRMLVPDQQISFVPEKVLATGVQGTVWWRKPADAMVWFNTKVERDGIGERCGRTPHPGLVFAVTEGAWRVFAVKGKERPNEETILYQAPYYNVNNGGVICVGNADIPRGKSVEDIAMFERAWFESRFTHPNTLGKKELTSYRGGAAALWKSLLAGKRKVFPESALVPTKLTLGALIAAGKR